MDDPKDPGIRLNKYIALSGLCSRRKAADLVKAGKVTVDGVQEKNPARQILEEEEVQVRGKKVVPQLNKVYLLMNKPKDTITTLSDEKGRMTVMDILGDKIKERVYPVGRLDRYTVGLLLLTNDGDLAKKLTHPSHEVPKVYEATLDKELPIKDMKSIEAGLELEDGFAPVDWINFPDPKDKTVVRLEIHIGRNRIVRRIFEHLGYHVKKLDRIYLAGLTKKDLPRGRWRHLREEEIRMLKHFV
ncbi:MAG: rRNA pseudouridine synthase [Saprospiraceae bacterium]|nr:rRNA pseudouridine synthase [Saprospiraceae bacterium]